MNIDYIIDRTKREEGFSSTIYNCPAGYPTIGYGHRLRPGENFLGGINKDGALILLEKDLDIAVRSSDKLLISFNKLCDARQACIVDMVYNMGFGSVSRFKLMLRNIREADFVEAGEEIMDSNYARQLPRRAKINCYMMQTGVPYAY